MSADDQLRSRIDRYLDASPRSGSDQVDVGPLRAFVSRLPWPFYARPRAETDLSGPGAVVAADLLAAAEVLRSAGKQPAFEWVTEVVPSMTSAAEAAGMDVTTYPLLVLDVLRPALPPAGVSVRLLGRDDPDVAAARAVAAVGFAHEGTACGSVGAAERDDELTRVDRSDVATVRRRIGSGRTAMAVAVDDSDGVVASAMLSPVPDVPDVAEVVGVAVLPAHRRRGIGPAITTVLAQHALRLGIEVVMLSAGSADVARVYERLGFRQVGHSGEAAPAAGTPQHD